MNSSSNISRFGLISSQHLELYNRILAFEIDEPDVCLSFSQRLARDNQWSSNYAHEVIEEYKKFLFLAISAGHPVTPSDAVDQTWHLHLSYTHSYWNDLCDQVLQKPLHHHPTQGGSSQRELFWDCYSKTLDSYEKFFGYPPPSHIWQSPSIRFQQAGQFRRVNTQDYWLVPKLFLKVPHLVALRVSRLSLLKTITIALLTFGAVLILCHPALTTYSNITHSFVNQPVLAQVSSEPSSNIPSQPNTKSFQYPPTGMVMVIGFIGSLTARIIVGIADTCCPQCNRFRAIRKTDCVVRPPTTQSEGKKLTTQWCRYCNYKKKWSEVIPRVDSYNDFGCWGCM